MTQYGLRTLEGKWLPRDAYRRGARCERLDSPDLWQNKERAEKYASQYDCELVEFIVMAYIDRFGVFQPFGTVELSGYGKSEV